MSYLCNSLIFATCETYYNDSKAGYIKQPSQIPQNIFKQVKLYMRAAQFASPNSKCIGTHNPAIKLDTNFAIHSYLLVQVLHILSFH